MSQRPTRSQKNKDQPSPSSSNEVDLVKLSIEHESSSPSTSLPQPKTNMAAKRKAPAKTTPKKAARKPKWTAEKLLSSTRSPLARANLRNLLCDSAAWQLLDQSDQDEIVARFPHLTTHFTQNEDGSSRPNFSSLRNDDSFRHDCAKYTENLGRGGHDPEWLESAWAAHEMRNMGNFDEYLANKFKDDWGVDMPGREVEEEEVASP